MARVRTYLMEPTSLSEALKEGRWWKRTLVGPHSPPMTRRGGFDDLIPPPELWHFDDRVWLRRSHLNPLMNRALRGEDPHALVLEDADGLTAEDRDRFWSDFHLTVCARNRHEWTGLRKMVDHIREKYGYRQLFRFERLIGRYGALLFAKLEPLFVEKGLAPAWGKVRPTLDAKTYYHLGLLTRHIIGEGRETYDAVIRDPLLAVGELEKMSMQSGNYFDALFRYEVFLFQAQKLRLLENYLEHEGRMKPTPKQRAFLDRVNSIVRRIFGAVEMVEFLKTQFKTEEDVLDVAENWPRFAMTPSGEVVRLPFPGEAREPPATAAELTS
jgi:hypothetical protein